MGQAEAGVLETACGHLGRLNMKEQIQAMKQLTWFTALKGAQEEQIATAEKELSLCFADDYRGYLQEYGLASANGHELTGICPSDRLNVVTVTKAARGQPHAAQSGWYVIEQANIDGIMIWQDAEGKVYQTQPGAQPVRITESLLEYLGAE